MTRRRFRAMGTDVEVLLDAPDDAAARRRLDAARDEFSRLERILSRFEERSELSRLNRRGALTAGPELAAVIGAALDARDETGGRFDPTVHDALVAAGYRTTFEDLEPAAAPVVAGPPPPCGGVVSLDRATRRVVLHDGTRLDLGGIAKGWAADRVAALLGPDGPCLVNAGGDVAVAGVPDAGAWAVGVATHCGPLTLALERGALATSGRDRRRWTGPGGDAHHVIDPATGRPSATDLLRVTVVHSTAARAEAWATALFLAGARDAAEEAERAGLSAVLVPAEGPAVLTGGLA